MEIKTTKVTNPLTIIAIFAGLAEVVATVSISVAPHDIQKILVWFIMGFPTLILMFFFLGLFKNPKMYYAPSDYKDDKSFLDAIGKFRISASSKIVKEKNSLNDSEKEMKEWECAYQQSLQCIFFFANQDKFKSISKEDVIKTLFPSNEYDKAKAYFKTYEDELLKKGTIKAEDRILN